MKTQIYNIGNRIPGYLISSKKIQKGIYEIAVFPLKYGESCYQLFETDYTLSELITCRHFWSMLYYHIKMVYKYKVLQK